MPPSDEMSMPHAVMDRVLGLVLAPKRFAPKRDRTIPLQGQVRNEYSRSMNKVFHLVLL